MNKTKVMGYIAIALVFIGLVSWLFILNSGLRAQNKRLTEFASTTAATLLSFQNLENQIINLRNGNVASSSDFIIAVYNADVVIQHQLYGAKQ